MFPPLSLAYFGEQFVLFYMHQLHGYGLGFEVNSIFPKPLQFKFLYRVHLRYWNFTLDLTCEYMKSSNSYLKCSSLFDSILA